MLTGCVCLLESRHTRGLVGVPSACCTVPGNSVILSVFCCYSPEASWHFHACLWGLTGFVVVS